MVKYVLIGIPGCGKSTLGRHAAALLNMPFYDTDEMAYDKIKSYPCFFASTQMRFLDEQRKAVADLALLESSAVIATGAEVALIPECAERMKNFGKIIHIKRRVDAVLDGLRDGDAPRLILRSDDGGIEISLDEKAVQLYSRELAVYDGLADVTLDNNGSETQGVANLTALIRELDR